MHYIGTDSKARGERWRKTDRKGGLVLSLVEPLPDVGLLPALLSILQQDNIVGLAAAGYCDLFAIRGDGERED